MVSEIQVTVNKHLSNDFQMLLQTFLWLKWSGLRDSIHCSNLQFQKVGVTEVNWHVGQLALCDCLDILAFWRGDWVNDILVLLLQLEVS